MEENKKRNAGALEDGHTGIARKLAVIRKKIKDFIKQLDNNNNKKLESDIKNQVEDNINNKQVVDNIKREIEEIQKQTEEIQKQTEEIQKQTEDIQKQIKEKQKQIKDIQKQIKDIQKQIKEKQKEIDTEVSVKQIYRLQGELIQLTEQERQLTEQERQLQKQKDQLQEKKDQLTEQERKLRRLQELQNELLQLGSQFGNGEYYAFTNAYWEIGEMKRKGNEWDTFVRKLGDKEKFQCRYAKGAHSNIYTTDPYADTRVGAVDKETCRAPPSASSSRSSAMPQSDKTARNAVWPRDIFGNRSSGEIAHLLPAGKESHKYWLNVACAVLGISRSADINVKKKAAAGCTNKIVKNDDPNTPTQGVASTSSSRDASNLAVGDSAGKKASPRMQGTGVIHFVANKIRLQDQKNALDGENPTCLIVPGMTLEDARDWRGEGYNAVCFAGVPENSDYAVLNNGELFKRIGLTTAALMEVDHPRDATEDEVEKARAFLETAVLALHDMIAGLTDEELDLFDTNSRDWTALKTARDQAQQMPCKVPRSVKQIGFGRKPACLVTFGEPNDPTVHPAPDPLLLVLKAANIFGIMAGMKMLANACPKDLDDISIGDIMAEEAFLEARERSYRPKAWDDLAKGLGQPNGYFGLHTWNPTDSLMKQ